MPPLSHSRVKARLLPTTIFHYYKSIVLNVEIPIPIRAKAFYFFKVCTSGGIRRLQEGFKGREFALQIRQFVREFTARVE